MFKVALDTETTGADFFHGCRPFYVSTCTSEGTIEAWEWDVDPKTRTPIVPGDDLLSIQRLLFTPESWVDADIVLEDGVPVVRRPGQWVRSVYHNTGFDRRALSLLGIDCGPWDEIDDTLIASHVLASAETHKLKELAIIYLDLPDDDETELKEAVEEARRFGRSHGWRIAAAGDPHFPAQRRAPSSGWRVMDYWLPRAVAKHCWEVQGNHKYEPHFDADGEIDSEKSHPFWTVLRRYAIQDAERTMGLDMIFQQALDEEDLRPQYETRLKLLEPIARMENNGVTASKSAIKEAKNHFRKLADTAEERCYALTGNRFDNVTSPQQLQGVMFGEPLNIKPITKTETGWSTRAEDLRAMLADLKPKSIPFTFILNLLKQRRFSKAVDYLDSYLLYGVPTVGDYLRIHPNFNITGTATTRFSSHNPNAQNISKTDADSLGGLAVLEGSNLRRAFGPAPGREWFSMDYENIEMRIFAYESGDQQLIEAFESGHSVHLIIAKILHPELYARCEKDGVSFKDRYKSTWYQWVKNGNFSLIYGAGKKKADATYRVSGAYEMIRKGLPLIDRFMDSKYKEGRRLGYVTTLGGYRLQVPRDKPHVAVNYFVQGSAGWAMILAIIRIYEYLSKLNQTYKMILTVHDELDFDFPKRKGNVAKIRKCKLLMEESGIDLGLPTPVEVDRISKTWAKGEVIAA